MSNRYLSTPLRRSLEKTIRDARVAAEDGAQDAIRRLGVADAKAPVYLGDREKDLRRRLRAHARALGDAFDKASDTQAIRKLVEATAYAHWHRMLFARFLAERNLLRHPVHNAPVTIEDCREFAIEENLADGWAVAERYAATMLPAVFRIEDPVLLVAFDAAHVQKLTRLVTDLDAEIFQAEDSLGWTYQYWRAAEKEAVNASGNKIGADELPAVTQLFTEPYMVRFLLHNTLGAWWAGKALAANPALATSATEEALLRDACALPGYEFDLLRFVNNTANDTDKACWRPAAGSFPGWPQTVAAITMLDPCCGSGHFLTEALTALASLRQQEEKLSPADAVAAVLRDNLHGLEIDGRCVQIAAFAVALTAWRIGGWQTLPLPHIAWVGAPPPLPKSDFVALADGDADIARALEALHNLFVQAPVLGSLLEPIGGDLMDVARIGRIENFLTPLISKARKAEPELLEGVVSAKGMADAAAFLTRNYTLQTTNVPYLGRGKQSLILSSFCAKNYPDAQPDLATCMMARMFKLCAPGGTIATVTPQNWLYLSRYKNLRDGFISQSTLNTLATLGPRAFETISGEVVNAALVILSNARPDPEAKFSAFDANDAVDPVGKATAIAHGQGRALKQLDVRDDPEIRISTQPTPQSGRLIKEVASVLVGATTGDAPRYIFKFWEWRAKNTKWQFFQTTAAKTGPYAGMTDSILWEEESGTLYRFAESVRHLNHIAQNWRRGKPNWGRRGVSVSMMTDLQASIYTGERYDSNCCAIVPHDEQHLAALWAYCSSEEFFTTIRSVNRSLKIEVGTILSSKIDLERWQAIAAKTDGGELPEPYSTDPTQWVFHGFPTATTNGSELHVGLVRLSGYSWPAELNVEKRLSAQGTEFVDRAGQLPQCDSDGLLALSSIAGEAALADRLRIFMAAAFDTHWSDDLERRLVGAADEAFDKKPARDGTLEGWLRDRAFRQHCALFQQRPFIWQIWDGMKDGFSVFVHYHRFDQAALRKLTYTVLGDWLARAKADGNELRYEKGRELQQKLEKILEGEKPYDIFVRWKSLAEQPIGWDPDLDDGVRMNIRPFVEAGVLRDEPKIKWTKDRGSDLTTAPWYHLGPKNGGKLGDRINDHHTSLAEKRAARSEPKKTEGGKS